LSVVYLDPVLGNDANTGTLNNPKKTLNSAVNVLSENGTINLAGGQYGGNDNVNIIINKSIKIIGKGASSTILNGNNQHIISISKDKTVRIEGCTFLNGENEQGGAISNFGHLNLTNCVFTNNHASLGGAVYNKNNLEVTGCEFRNNHANLGNSLGGAIYTRQGICKVSGTVFESNDAYGDGGAVNNNYDGYLILINTRFQTNHARSAGALCNAMNCDIYSCEFIQNTAERMGGAIFSMGNLKINNTQFNQNNAKFDVGGAIGTDQGESSYSTNINNTKFYKNHAKSSGAISSNGELLLYNINFIENSADENGGAVGSSKDSFIAYSNFLNNHADNYAGAILGVGGLNNFVNNNFVNNSAEYGGAVFVTSSSIININNFVNNSAKMGGAVYSSFHGDASYPSVRFTLNNFYKNSARELGGAMANTGSLTMSKNNFTLNQISGLGTGGALLNINGTVYIEEWNEFFHNVVNDSITNTGGGLANFEGHIFVSGQGNRFIDSNILNKGYLNIKDCCIEKNTEDGNYLDNNNSRGFKETNTQILDSNHSYQSITDKSCYDFWRDSKEQFVDLAPTYFDKVNPVSAHKGDKVHVVSQLWCHYFLPWDWRVEGVTVKFRLYDKYGKYVDEWKNTNWFGYAEIDIDTSMLNPGDYCLLVSYDGVHPSKPIAYRPIFLSCLKSVPFTVMV
jgi:predicted outer membrane repeat protein